MRLLMDTVVALMLVALLGGVMWQQRTDQEVKSNRDLARAEVRRFQQQIALQSALAKVERNERGYPETVDPDWFMGNLPANPLLDFNHPWLEVAGPDQKQLAHPLDRVANAPGIAKFWYNPHMGVLRARVPAEASDAAAIDLYNYINDSALPDLFAK